MPQLLDRRAERGMLDKLLADVRSRRGRALVLRGEAGIGKSTLLGYAVESASGMRVIRTLGVESEMELAFASTHLLCTPLLDQAEALPTPQREALGVAFGLQKGTTPDRFLVGLAVLTLLAHVAEERPVLCVIDDAQWLDAASAQVLGFVARRLLAEPVGLIFAAREPAEELQGLEELELRGLADQDARELLRSVVPSSLDEQVRERILAETGGNPLALLELPRGLSPAKLAGGFGLIGTVPAQIEQGFRLRIEALPAETRMLMLIAAAEPTGDSFLIWQAAARLGIPTTAAQAAQAEGLLEEGARVRFRHPLVRSAVYRAAPVQERWAAHRALAESTDRRRDPDRRAWHLAAAAVGPDEEVAAELESSAGRAQARGGMAAAAAFLGRSAELSVEPASRSGRALAAAQASLQAGAFDTTSELLDLATTAPLDDLQQAVVDLLRGQLVFVSSAGSDAPALLVKAAKQLEPLDASLARQTHLDAWIAALFAGQFAGLNDLYEVSRIARSAPATTGEPRPSDQLLNALAVLITEGHAEAAPLLRQAARAFADDEMSGEERVRWAIPAIFAAVMVWDEKCWDAIQTRIDQTCREAGLLVQLVFVANTIATLAAWRTDLATAASLMAEADSIVTATGTGFPPAAAVFLAGYRGREAEAETLIAAAMADSRAAGQGIGVQNAQWISSVLYNGLGRYEDALGAARAAAEEAPQVHLSMWALPELIEAASRTGENQVGAEALAKLAEATSVSETDWAQGIYARSRALLSQGPDAENSHREAIDRLGRCNFRAERARAHLLYGEWLRRERRRTQAREQLRTALQLFEEIGMEGFAARARSELQATGERARRRHSVPTGIEELTPHEAQIARLARDGLTNPEIGARLFLSPRTVQYHLGNVFLKLGISSRVQLDRVLPAEQSAI